MTPPLLFTDHPASVGETYRQHLAVASSFGLRMILGGFACMIHGVLPFLFVKTGSRQIAMLHARMNTHRQRGPAPSQLEPRLGQILDFVI